MITSFVMVIFGASGELTRTKLIPALFSLFKQGILPKDFSIIGFARRDLTKEAFLAMFAEFTKDDTWDAFAKHITYQQGKFEEKDKYEILIKRLLEIDEKKESCLARFFYLATPPVNYQEIIENLYKSKLSKGCGHKDHWTRIIVEKPFGKDLDTAKALDKRLSEIFEEKQIFRVDHYLGKETVQNILAFRFANGIFEPVWNKNYLDHVQITWGETKGVEGRGAFFDGVGILRDFLQNHVMQLIASVAMEQPKSFSREGVRDARAAAIKAVRSIKPEEVSDYLVRGQYEGYREIEGVTEDSTTETFLAAKMLVDTDRFANIPFYVRVGKKMPETTVEVSMVFIQTCHLLFREYGCPEIGNVLTFRIQPDEGIGLRVIAKKPGSKLALDTVTMDFSYRNEFGGKVSDAYEKLLLDIFAGDQMLFNRSDELESSWGYITNVMKGWEKEKKKATLSYKPGTWGPKEANKLIEKDGRRWL